MVVRENAFLETYKSLKENRSIREAKREKAYQDKINERQNFMNDYYSIMESRREKERDHSRLLEGARNDALSTVLKAIYITALEANTLTDDGIVLAESMVDGYIKEKGGARNILSECKNTYLLARITKIVEDAAEDEVKDIEKDESKDNKKDNKEDKKSEDKKEDPKKNDDKKSEDKDDNPLNNATDFDDDDDKKSSKNDDKKSNGDTKSEEKKENKEDKKEDNPLNNATDFDDDDDNETDDANDIIDDIEPEEDKDSDDEKKDQGKIFDDLEKEEDVKKAVELIRQRVADAEESFIKRNAEDKKQIDELLGKISDNVKKVEDISDDNSGESKVAEESARISKRKIQQITENRPLTVLEKMTRNLSSGIVANTAVREQYVNENGSLDMAHIFESSKVMYGFLETLQTLQLEKVDSNYITKVLNEMK